MDSYKWSYKSLNVGHNYSYLTSSPTYNYPGNLQVVLKGSSWVGSKVQKPLALSRVGCYLYQPTSDLFPMP